MQVDAGVQSDDADEGAGRAVADAETDGSPCVTIGGAGFGAPIEGEVKPSSGWRQEAPRLAAIFLPPSVTPLRNSQPRAIC